MEVIAVIGLGYVGLPLAVELSKHFKTIGFDIDQNRILELQNGQDRTLEISAKDLSHLDNLSLTDDLTKLNQANFYIVTVPTPVDDANQPDFSPLISATRSIASILKKGDIIVYESTVYPGATEEICVPLLEDISKLKFNKDFLVGYSPERINPGDKNHHLADITKIISGSNIEALNRIEKVYEKIIKAGLHKTSSIKVAEAAKVIENTQRDINIALINELAMLFEKLGIDTKEVLDAAGTKWNFQKFSPGLVGGHCIGVDPYYLTYKAALVDFHPELILAGRKTNDNMSNYIAGRALKELSKNKRSLHGSKCLLLGLTFKENCPDLRNSGALTLKKVLESYGIIVTTCDPWVDLGNLSDSQNASHINLTDIQNFTFDIAIIAVAHNQFKEIGPVLRNASPEGIIFDLKSCIDANFVNLRL
jgi:UDP-N-acetyl-D-galactosamine dehydrogenase